MPQYKLLLIALLALAFTGCASTTVPDPDPTNTAGSADTGMDDSSNSGSGMGDGSMLDDDSMAEGLAHVIYFDFDSSELRPADTDVVARHAMILGKDSGASVRLAGHADERGSREYNIGLGERRAQTVRRLLLIQGASASQISTVSFGEERPAAEGSNEAAYAQNRRVEITYTH